MRARSLVAVVCLTVVFGTPAATQPTNRITIAADAFGGAPELERLVENIAPGRDFGETPELTLVIDTPRGQVALVGCSHPGIERILASLGAPSRPVHLLAGVSIC